MASVYLGCCHSFILCGIQFDDIAQACQLKDTLVVLTQSITEQMLLLTVDANK
jgi:hypothetical protein